MKTWTHRLLAITAVMLALFLSKCGSSEGLWSRAEFEAWYAENLPNYYNLERVRYRGSDASLHYFLIRPVDWFVIVRIPRTELTIADERPYAGGSSVALGYNDVDVLRGFAKIAGP